MRRVSDGNDIGSGGNERGRRLRYGKNDRLFVGGQGRLRCCREACGSCCYCYTRGLCDPARREQVLRAPSPVVLVHVYHSFQLLPGIEENVVAADQHVYWSPDAKAV